MFGLLLRNLRGQGVSVGLSEWLTFLKAVKLGLASNISSLHALGRTIMCTSEAQFDSYDVAFEATFEGVELPPDLSAALMDWLNDPVPDQPQDDPNSMSIDEMWKEFYERLKKQEERHDGGARWIGTGGKSPFGNHGAAKQGIRVGGAGRNRSALAIVGERRWRTYRTDRRLEQRDFQMALKALRKLAREGQYELDVDDSIKKTSDNGGEIELSYRRKRQNRVHLVLIMDTGGSMDPHTQLVERLFTAASELKGFKSFAAWQFHNVPYGKLYKGEYMTQGVAIEQLLMDWTPEHRLVWVGDASMASYELFNSYHRNSLSGLGWLQRIRRSCPASVWLNPDPQQYWNHPTVRAIGAVYPMYPLTLDGLHGAVKRLKKGRTD
ncbi:MAG: VWA domain-containing protein [Myxococcota bacterium]